MRLYNSLGPNPRCVRMFMAEKGVTLPAIELDILAAQERHTAGELGRSALGAEIWRILGDGPGKKTGTA